MVSDFREGQCQPLSSGPLTRHDVNAQSHIPHKPPHKTHNSLSSLYPSSPPLAVTAYLVATSRSWKVRTLKKPSHYSTCIAINYACMHALSYAHHSPIIVLFSLWCQEKRKKEKGRSFEERKMPFSPVFELSTVSLSKLCCFSQSSSIIKLSITKSFPHLSHHTFFSVLPKKSCTLLPPRIYYSLFEEWAI